MRAILANWEIEVHRKFELMPEIFTSQSTINWYLSMRTIPEENFSWLASV